MAPAGCGQEQAMRSRFSAIIAAATVTAVAIGSAGLALAAEPPAPAPAAGAPAAVAAPANAAPPGAYLYIGWPNDGQLLARGKPIRVWFGLRNMGVAPKGVAFPGTGHHHLLIDTAPPAAGTEIPSNRSNLHFGTGETETTIELAPGRHTLQLVMGDQHHISFDPPVVSKKITITVK
jgi:hypothetical protein